MRQLNTKLQNARPRLSVVSPLVFKISIGFGVVNILLGIALWQVRTTLNSSTFILLNSVTTYKFWGVVFGVTGLVMFYALYRNNWQLIKSCQIFGLFIKTLWFVALLIRLFQGTNTMTLLAIWIFFMYVQALTVIYFIPPGIHGEWNNAE